VQDLWPTSAFAGQKAGEVSGFDQLRSSRNPALRGKGRHGGRGRRRRLRSRWQRDHRQRAKRPDATERRHSCFGSNRARTQTRAVSIITRLPALPPVSLPFLPLPALDRRHAGPGRSRSTTGRSEPGRTTEGTVGTEHTAITRLGAQHCAAATALVKEDAGIRRHRFNADVSTRGARQRASRPERSDPWGQAVAPSACSATKYRTEPPSARGASA
jgi:hypothetical protein